MIQRIDTSKADTFDFVATEGFDGAVEGRDFLTWQRNVGTSATTGDGSAADGMHTEEITMNYTEVEWTF